MMKVSYRTKCLADLVGIFTSEFIDKDGAITLEGQYMKSSLILYTSSCCPKGAIGCKRLMW